MFSFLRPGQANQMPSIPAILQEVAAGRMQLVDVREIAEARGSGVAEGARVIPLSLLAVKADPRLPGCELKQGLPVAVYCASGARSASAAQFLQKLGYGEVTNLGGLRDVAAAGGKVVPFKG